MIRQGTWVYVLGAGPWQLPTVMRAKELGCRVFVTDRAKDRPCYAVADAHALADISDPEAVLAAARTQGVDAIVCDTTDAGVYPAAFAADALGLPSIGAEVARRFTSKLEMRKACVRAGIEQPPFREARTAAEFDDAVKALGFPLVVKPMDAMAGVGVRRVPSADGAHALFEEARSSSKSGTVIVERFIAGTEVTVEGVVVDGEPKVLAISDKAHFPQIPWVAERITYPTPFGKEVVAQIHDMNRRVVKALGLRSGVTHAEYFVTENGVVLVEIAARGGGSQIFSHAVPLHTGVDLLTANLRMALGEPFEPIPTPGATPQAVQIQFFHLPKGRITAVRGLDELRNHPNTASLYADLKVGDELLGIGSDRDRRLHAVIAAPTREEVLALGARARQTVQIDVA